MLFFIIRIDKEVSSKESRVHNVLKIREMLKARGCWVPPGAPLLLLLQESLPDVGLGLQHGKGLPTNWKGPEDRSPCNP